MPRYRPTRPLVILKEPEDREHRVWLDQNSDTSILHLTMDPTLYVPVAANIVATRLRQDFGIPPKIQEQQNGAYFVYDKSASVNPEELFVKAGNTLRDLKSLCDGKRTVKEALKIYQQQMNDKKASDNFITDEEVLAFKPTLHTNEIKDAIASVLRKINDNNLSKDQKEKLGNILARQLNMMPRPNVKGAILLGTDNSIAAKQEPIEQDALFIIIHTAVGEVAKGPAFQSFLSRELYDALQEAYKARAGEMPRK